MELSIQERLKDLRVERARSDAGTACGENPSLQVRFRQL